MAGNRRNIVYHLVAFGVGIAILAGLIWYAGFERFLQTLERTSPQWVLLAVAICASSWVFRVWRLGMLTKRTGKRIENFELFKLHISGYAINVTLPAKLGDVVTIGYLKMKGMTLACSAAVVLQTRVLDVFAVVLLTVPALLLSRGETPGWVALSIAASVLIVVVPIGVAFVDAGCRISKAIRKTAQGFSGLPKALLQKAADAYEAYRGVVTDMKLLLASLLLSLLIWFLEGLACYSVSIAVGLQVPLIIVIFAVCIGNLGKTAPATPGSIGIYESIVAAVLTLFGVPFELAVATAILDHAIKNIFTLAVGIPATAGLGLDLAHLYDDIKTKGLTAGSGN